MHIAFGVLPKKVNCFIHRSKIDFSRADQGVKVTIERCDVTLRRFKSHLNFLFGAFHAKIILMFWIKKIFVYFVFSTVYLIIFYNLISIFLRQSRLHSVTLIFIDQSLFQQALLLAESSLFVLEQTRKEEFEQWRESVKNKYDCVNIWHNKKTPKHPLYQRKTPILKDRRYESFLVVQLVDDAIAKSENEKMNHWSNSQRRIRSNLVLE